MRSNRLPLMVFAIAAASSAAMAQVTPQSEAAKAEAEKEAYWEEFGEWREKWLMKLAFNPSIYFQAIDAHDNPQDELESRNAVDARYWIGLRGIQWAFAIDKGCPNKDETWAECKNPGTLIRAAQGKSISETPKASRDLRPKTEDEMRVALDQWMRWDEADLSKCPGALEQLAKLNQFKNDKIWSKREENGLLNKPQAESGDIMVRADGDYAIVRANSFDFYENHIWTDKGDEGTHGAWARGMMKIAQPCLKPTTATAPWNKKPDPE